MLGAETLGGPVPWLSETYQAHYRGVYRSCRCSGRSTPFVATRPTIGPAVSLLSSSSILVCWLLSVSEKIGGSSEKVCTNTNTTGQGFFGTGDIAEPDSDSGFHVDGNTP